MPIHKVWSSYSPNAEFETYLGKPGEIFYKPDTGTIHVSDGVTPGGLAIASEGTIENSQKLNGELPDYYLDYNNFTNTPTQVSAFANDAGYITSADGGNADQLDGEQGSYYLDYNNFTNTPTQVSAFANDAGYITSPDGGNADQLDGEDSAFYLNYANFTGVPTDLSDFDNDLDFIQSSEKGAVDGVATLNGTGLVPPSQLPSFVSDVEEYASFGDFPAEGDTGKIYVADDTGDIYRWSGSSYIKISDAASTADEAVKLATARTISLTGDATGSVVFDGTSDVSINTVIEDDSHSHVIANVDGLQGALDSKLELTDLSATGDLSYNSTTGEFAFTERTDAEVRGLVSAGGDLSYNSTTGEFSVTTYKSTDFDTDFGNKSTTDLSEGTNLYYTDGRANSAIDARVDKTFVDNLDVDADTLDGEESSYYLDYNNFTNTPSGQNLSDDGATTDITADTVSVINLPNSEIGPVQALQFDTDYVVDPPYPNGAIRWNQSDNTLNINHDGGVVQQVGQEFFYFVRNETGTTIPNGTVVKFAGASEADGEPRLLIDEFLADGSDPSLYCLGITTQTCENNQPCRVVVDGKVRGIDTTGTPYGETWAVGDILYASPSVSGGLTKFKPTAPDNVLPIAAVVKTDATEGHIQVRATIEQDLSYGRFVRLTDFTFAAANTAYALDYDATDISNGVEVVNDTELEVNQSGFYQIDVNLQADATGGGFSSAVLYTWVRVNGTDVEHTARRQGILGSAPSSTFSFALALSLDAGDKLEVMVASNSTNLVLDAADATSFAPSTASALVAITQLQL